MLETYLQSGLEALGDPTRFAIFRRLIERPLPVNELAAMMPVSRPAVSQHLKVLKSAGLVSDTREGSRRLYAVNPEGVELLRQHFDKLWETALASFQTAAAQPKPKEKHERARRTRRS